MPPKVIITRKTFAPSVQELVDDAFVKLVLTRVTEIYKAHNYPTTPAAVELGLRSTFQSVSSKIGDPEYMWVKNTVTCHYELVCINGTEIAIADGANDPVLVRIQDEIVIV